MSNDTKETPLHVVVTDIRMPFLSMVVFMVKWAFASIPAITIFATIVFAVTLKIGPLVSDIFKLDAHGTSRTSSSRSSNEFAREICESKGLTLILNDKGEPKCETPEDAAKQIQNMHDQIMRQSKP